jgi:hypothetical protein
MKIPPKTWLLALLSLLAACDNSTSTGPVTGPSGGGAIVVGNFVVTTNYEHVDTLPTVDLKNLEMQLGQGPVTVVVKNNGTTPAPISVSVGIQDYTSAPGIQTLTIPPGDTQEFTPEIFLDPSKMPGLTTLTPSNYQVKVTVNDNGTEKPLFTETHPVALMARDTWAWNWAGVSLYDYIALFVTPSDTAVQNFLGTALKYTPNNQFAGYSGNTLDSAETSDSIDVPAGGTVGFIKPLNFHLSLNLSYSSKTPVGLLLQDPQGNTLIQTTPIASLSSWYAPYSGGQWSFQNPGNSTVRVKFQTKLVGAVTSTGSTSVHDEVGAVYKALHDRGITYSSTTLSFPSGSAQKVRFPEDALHQAAANCIDGTVLMASALEAIGINPIIIIIPGHAFLGWRDDPGSSVVEFVETTLIGSTDFETAVTFAMSEYYKAYLANNIIDVVDVQDARQKGLLPAARKLPY